MVIPHLTLVGFGNICLPAPMTGADSVTQNLACPLCPPRSDNRLRIYRHRGSTLMRPDNSRETAGSDRTCCEHAAGPLRADGACVLQCFQRLKRAAKKTR